MHLCGGMLQLVGFFPFLCREIFCLKTCCRKEIVGGGATYITTKYDKWRRKENDVFMYVKHQKLTFQLREDACTSPEVHADVDSDGAVSFAHVPVFHNGVCDEFEHEGTDDVKMSGFVGKNGIELVSPVYKFRSTQGTIEWMTTAEGKW